MKKIVVWYNPYKDYCYYKVVSFHYRPYVIGERNSYGHIIIFVIDNIKNISFYKKRGYVWKGVDWNVSRGCNNSYERRYWFFN